MAKSGSLQQPYPTIPRWRQVAGGLVGGAVGGLVWGVMNIGGIGSALKAAVVGAAAIGAAELVVTVVSAAWQRRFAFGLVGGTVAAVVSYVLFQPDEPFARHLTGILSGAVAGGFVVVFLRERHRRPTTTFTSA